MTQPDRTASAHILGRYELGPVIASGGMGTVHLGRLLGPGRFSRFVAIKHLHPHLARDAEFASMFLDEARLAARIRHTNVASVLDVVEEDGDVFLVVDYIHGEALSQLLRASAERGERVDVDVAVALVTGVLHGLHAAHEATDENGEPLRIVHRDVSPQNVLVGTDGVPRMADFGIAKASGRIHSTRDGLVKGKLSYMAPEQVLEQPVDRRTDVYAASVLLWEILTGRRLFQNTDVGATVAAILAGAAPPPSWYRSDVPPVIDEMVLRGLSLTPNERFATAREMALALERATPRASSSAVTAWLESTAGESLKERSALMCEIERASSGRMDGSGSPASELSAPTQLTAERSVQRASPSSSRQQVVTALLAAGVTLIAVAAALPLLPTRGAGPAHESAPTTAWSAVPSVSVSGVPPRPSASRGRESRSPCEDGAACRPIALASGLVGVSALAVSAGQIYFTTSSAVLSVPADGGPVRTLSRVPRGAYAIATLGDRLYFSGANDVFELPTSGGIPSRIARTTGTALGIAADKSGVYFTAADSVGRVSPDGTSTAFAGGQQSALTVAVRDGFVYWTCYEKDGTVARSAIDGSRRITLSSGETYPAGIAADDSYVYYTVQNAGLVAKIPLSGGKRHIVATSLALPTGIAVDGEWLYVTAQKDGTVLKVPTAGGTPVVIASNQRFPTAIVADESGVYWINTDFPGAVMRLAK